MLKNVLITAMFCSLVSGGLIPRNVSAMLPLGNDAHRRFYKDQEWIWAAAGDPATASVNLSVQSVVSFTMPMHLPEASLAFTMPTHPPQTGLAFTMPTHPPETSLAFTMPTHPPQA